MGIAKRFKRATKSLVCIWRKSNRRKSSFEYGQEAYDVFSDEAKESTSESEAEESLLDSTGPDFDSGSSSDDDEFFDAVEYFEEDQSQSSSSDENSLEVKENESEAVALPTPRRRRSAVPVRPDIPFSLWSIMKNCIGKELTKIPMPVNFSEPLSVLQRLTEDLEYAHLLEKAADLSSIEQMCYVAAYAVSSYSTTGDRTTKPFNPMLGETFECDRRDDLGWRSIAEQVSHHPPATAHHAEGKGWTMYQDFTMTSKFRGRFLSVTPIGYTNVVFPASGNHYTYKKVTTNVHNIIMGKLWIDNYGDMQIKNHKTGETCNVNFAQYSFFGRDQPRRVHAVVKDAQDRVRYIIKGFWDSHLDCSKVIHDSGTLELETEAPVRIWGVNPPIAGKEKMHKFTRLAIELNEEEEGVAPTDSRRRPDQRFMEDGRWDDANNKKEELEEKQRAKRKKREAEIEEAKKRGQIIPEVQPTWFDKVDDPVTASAIHLFKGEYWKAKEASDWDRCPNIF